MADVELDVELDDDTSGPAKTAADGLRNLEDGMRRLSNAADSVTRSAKALKLPLRDARGRFVSAGAKANELADNSTAVAISFDRVSRSAHLLRNAELGISSASSRMSTAKISASGWVAELRASRGVVSSVSARAASGFSTQFTWLGRLNQAYARFASMHPGITGGINRMAGAFRGLGSDISQGVAYYLPGLVTKLVQVGTVAVAAFGAAAAAATAFFSRALIQAASLHERATLTFQAISRDGSMSMERLRRLAMDMGTTLGDTFEGMRALMAAGFSTDDAERWFKRMQDLSMIGIGDEVRKRIVLAMSQIRGAGQLQGDELRQLQETGLNVGKIWENIASQLGISVAEAKKLKEQGKISADVALKGIEAAIADLTGATTAGAARQTFLDRTMTGAFERLKSQWSLLLDDLVTSAGPTFETIAGLLGDLATYMQSEEFGALKEKLGGAIEGVGPILTAIADGIREIAAGFREVMATGGAEMLREINKGFGDMTPMSDESRQALRDFGTLLAWLTILTSAWVNNQLQIVSLFVQVGTAAWGAYSAVSEAIDAVMKSAFEKLAGLFDIGSGGGSDLIGGLVSGIRGGIGAVAAAVGDVVGTVTAAFTNPLGIHSDSTLYEQYGRNITGGLKSGIESGLPDMNDILSRASGLIVPRFDRPITSRSMENGDYVLPSQRGIAPSVSPADFQGIVPAMAPAAAGGAAASTGAQATVNLYVSGVGPDAAQEWERLRPMVRREAEQAIRSAGAS